MLLTASKTDGRKQTAGEWRVEGGGVVGGGGGGAEREGHVQATHEITAGSSSESRQKPQENYLWGVLSVVTMSQTTANNLPGKPYLESLQRQ